MRNRASRRYLAAGAERLHTASTRPADNLDTIRAAADSQGGTAERLLGATATVNTALAATERVVADQRSLRDALASVVSDLRTTIATAKREASVTAALVDGLQVASQRLVDAQHSAETYLEGVTAVLGSAHAEFAGTFV